MRKKILIVEDAPDMRQLIARLLWRDGYQPIEAESGEKALAAAVHEQPDLVLLDLVLPGIDGWLTLDMLRELGNDNLPVVVVTAHDEVRHRVQAYMTGATTFLVKPFRPKDLRQSIERALTASSAVSDRARSCEA